MSTTLMGENFNPIKRTIKNNNIFLVTDANGNIIQGNASGYGLYTNDTRFLSQLELKINGVFPVVLSSSTETGHSSVVISTNPLMNDAKNKDIFIPQETIQIKRESIIYGSFFETIKIANYNLFKVQLKLDLFFEADFLDIFEVRSISKIEKEIQRTFFQREESLSFIYKDSTSATMETEIKFIEKIPFINSNKVSYIFELEPSSEYIIKYEIQLKSTASLPEKLSAYDFDEAFNKALNDDENWEKKITSITSDNEDFNEIIQRNNKDISMLIINTHYGRYIAAGIPWYATLFGRDSLITARQLLMIYPEIAKDILITLARFQGKEENDWQDEEPGKIPHEIRYGELARSGKVPHSPYYGTVDATMLWIILLYDYFKWTNDIKTLNDLWPNALECLKWMENNYSKYGFISYKKRSSSGLDNQCWKDSDNSMCHEDGIIAKPPIAAIEVQSYYYDAKLKMAELAEYMGDNSLKIKILTQLKDFKKKFNKYFWIEDLQYYAMGLDKNLKPLRVISSNPGHCFESGIMDEEKANITAERLFKSDMFSGWGIRTLSKDSLMYNPMSYHNGSVWPHDNSIIAYGLSKIGKMELVNKIHYSLFDAARLMNYKRLPELFCGFSRLFRKLDPPVLYPVACIPQAWSAGVFFQMLQATLNFEPDAQKNSLKIANSYMPPWLNFIKINNLKIGDTILNIEIRRTLNNMVVDIIEKKGNIDIYIKK